MAYKSLRDRFRSDALVPFLSSSSLLVGNLIIFLVSRRIRTLFSDPGDGRLLPELVVAERGWNQRSFHRLLLVGSLGGLLLSGLSAEDQDILFVCDEDEIAPNPKKHDHAGHVIHHCIERYAPGHHGLFVFVTTEGNFDELLREDAVAIPDLAAGALVDAFNAYGPADRARDHQLWLPLQGRISQKASVILKWLAEGDRPLASLVVVLDAAADQVGVTVFRPVQTMADVFCLA